MFETCCDNIINFTEKHLESARGNIIKYIENIQKVLRFVVHRKSTCYKSIHGVVAITHVNISPEVW